MRISDWSSDVCSSDLHDVGIEADADARVAQHEERQRRQEGLRGPVVAQPAEQQPGATRHQQRHDDAENHGGPGEPALQIAAVEEGRRQARSEEHTSELQSLMRISYDVFCLKKKK